MKHILYLFFEKSFVFWWFFFLEIHRTSVKVCTIYALVSLTKFVKYGGITTLITTAQQPWSTVMSVGNGNESNRWTL